MLFTKKHHCICSILIFYSMPNVPRTWLFGGDVRGSVPFFILRLPKGQSLFALTKA